MKENPPKLINIRLKQGKVTNRDFKDFWFIWGVDRFQRFHRFQRFLIYLRVWTLETKNVHFPRWEVLFKAPQWKNVRKQTCLYMEDCAHQNGWIFGKRFTASFLEEILLISWDTLTFHVKFSLTIMKICNLNFAYPHFIIKSFPNLGWSKVEWGAYMLMCEGGFHYNRWR